MEVTDVRGINIQKGVHVRYTGTGSTGEVMDYKSDNSGSWVLMDTTDLWYRSDAVEVINENEYSKIKNHIVFKQEQGNEEVNEKENIKAKVKKAKGGLEDVDMSNELCDGGG